jgi:hypothetical protein
MKAHWGVRALHACVFSPLLGLLKPPRTSDCITVVVSGRLEFIWCDAPSPVLVEFFNWRCQLESTLGCACAPCLRF